MDNQDASLGIKILSFILPFVGIFLYFYKLGTAPKYAKSCVLWGLLGLAVEFAIAIILSPMA